MIELSEEDFRVVMDTLRTTREQHRYHPDGPCVERMPVMEFGKPETVRFEDSRCGACKLYDRLIVEKSMTPADPAAYARFLRTRKEQKP